MLKKSLVLTSSALAVSAAFAVEPEVAQDGVQQVVVTAQKRSQTTIDVPQSMSVIGGDTLEKEQATGFADYLKLVPSLQLVQSTPGAGRLVMRGLDTGGVASTVAVYLDETAFGSSSGMVNGAALAGDFDTFDIARVEVLRGPQGALYGASSLGGLVKFVTNTPDTERFLLRARAGLASIDGGGLSYRSNLVVNTPLSDTLAFRVSGSYVKDGGYIDSIGIAGSDRAEDINGARNYGGRASLMYTPTKDFSLRLTAVAPTPPVVSTAEAANATNTSSAIHSTTETSVQSLSTVVGWWTAQRPLRPDF